MDNEKKPQLDSLKISQTQLNFNKKRDLNKNSLNKSKISLIIHPPESLKSEEIQQLK